MANVEAHFRLRTRAHKEMTDKTESQLKKFLETTTIHGPSELLTSGSVKRAAWLTILLLVFILCISQLLQLTTAFVEQQAVTEISSSQEGLPDIGVLIPLRYILNKMYTDKVALTNIERHGLKYAYFGFKSHSRCLMQANHSSPFLDNTIYKDTNDLTHEKQVLSDLKGSALHEMLNKVLMPEMTRSIKKVSRSVRYTDISAEVNTSEAVSYRLTAVGPSALIKLSQFSTSDTATLDISIVADTKMIFHVSGGDEALRLDHDFKNTLPIFPLVDGKTVLIKLNMVRYTTLPCNANLKSQILSCEGMCQVEKAVSRGECLPFLGSVPGIENVTRCATKDLEQCMRTFSECQQYCKVCGRECTPCSKVMATFERMHEADTNERILKIHIPFEGVMQYNTKPQIDAISFFSQVGGTLGLCFGVSTISIAHIFFACCDMARMAIGRKIGKFFGTKVGSEG